ncbi:MAG: poly-beta-1,6-N-acetyl-D-glucosamine N-deacetylase PgaB [Gammaproteobacteria bacterium]|nr:poly-beta-1,6-N-acetyl-D-glucosamine N-deacetylase PgaB [Gammaproteobacteria bacterium]
MSQRIQAVWAIVAAAALCHAPSQASEQPARGSQLTVLSYHEVSEAPQALIPDYAVTPTNFLRQVDWLRNNGFNFVSVDDVLADHAGRRALPAKPVLLTFDDGYESVYRHAWPVLKMFRIPAVVAVVGSWEEDTGDVDFDGKRVPRQGLMSWAQLREMSDSGLVEIASHSFDLHRGIRSNPQGNLQPAAVTRRYLGDGAAGAGLGGRETEEAYRTRVLVDLKESSAVITRRVGKAPRIIAWPYGQYNAELRDAAERLGMVVGLTLDDGANTRSTPLSRLRRILVERSMGLSDLDREIAYRNRDLTDNDRPQKVAHVDLDFIYDADEAQQERNLSHLLDRLSWLGVNTVYLQAYSDPDANGSADGVYFPSRRVPMRADLFNRVAWQIRTRTPVKRLYAWMPLLAWELPKTDPAAADRVTALPGKAGTHLNMGYARLSPFSPRARAAVREIYEDLARSVRFEGLLFHDDVTLSDFEDTSPDALRTYREWGLPGSVAEIRASDDLIGRWTILKINALDEFAKQMAAVVRREQPALVTARNLYAQVALDPRSEVWYSQALENSLANYDFTAIMAMPYMENAADPVEFQRRIVERVKAAGPEAMGRVVFELQTVDWRQAERPIPTAELVDTIRSLYGQGVRHIAYYPDMMFENHPAPAEMRAVFALKRDRPEVE